jgi:hypothetical protein
MQSRNPGSQYSCWAALQLEFHHVEVALGGAAFRTNPVVRNIGPPGAGRDTLVGVTGFLVIDVAAGAALPGFIGRVSHSDSLVLRGCGRVREQCRALIYRRPVATARAHCYRGGDVAAVDGG